MSPLENLYYAIGELAYAIARADGEVQKAERQKFANIVAAELRCDNAGFEIAEIIFKVLDKDQGPSELAYDWAIKQIRLNSHYLSPELKSTALAVMEKVAKAFPPVTREENKLIARFRKDIEPLVGDPVYFGKVARPRHDK